MPKLLCFTVLPALPDALKELEIIAHNVFWSWDSESFDLFRRIDSKLWTASGHNPIKFLASVSQERLEKLAQNESFLHQLKQIAEKLKLYLQRPTWFEKNCSESEKPVIAYFSAEFGIHECLPIYAGGLGLLAADHLKSASDLGVPIVAVGLLYQKGYFRQYLNVDGWQQELYTESDFYAMPIELVCKENGQPLTVSVEYPGRTVHAQIWCVCVGRVKLYLLDTNIPDNSPADRMITVSLYGGDLELRIRQEIMLGIGGLKALKVMGIDPAVCHMNEGHAAFMALERIRELKNEKNISFDEALEATKAGNVFTMHTLVKAGLDEFPVEMMDKYFGSYFPNLGINKKQFFALGRIFPEDDNETFKMPILALRLSSFVNGVSKLHSQISREVWSALWPQVPVNEVPIASITNGIHIKTWLSDEINALYQRYLGTNWDDDAIDNSCWKKIDHIPDELLWQCHQQCKSHLIAFARNRLKTQMKRRGTYHTELNQADEVLDLDALTIGFARRVASYKRANLLLKDPQRLVKLLADKARPVQIIFAGKAHPRDTEGKEIIKQIINFAAKYNLRRHIVFLEDYDINVARVLVRGVDVWLNNPRRPMEASGTSGMKAAINAALNISTLDGWWCEGYTPNAGWAIGAGETYKDNDYQDIVESQTLYNILENEVVPLFYTRSADGVPRAWIKRVKNSIKAIAPRFNAHRMVVEYTQKFYNPAAEKLRYLNAQALEKAKSLAAWKANIKKAWPELAIKDVSVEVNDGQSSQQLNPNRPRLKVGSKLSVSALINLATANPDDVSVELYYGLVDAYGNIRDGSAIKMDYEKAADHNGEHWFVGSVACHRTGQCGLAVRVLPKNPDLSNPYEMGLIIWESTPPQVSIAAN